MAKKAKPKPKKKSGSKPSKKAAKKPASSRAKAGPSKAKNSKAPVSAAGKKQTKIQAGKAVKEASSKAAGKQEKEKVIIAPVEVIQKPADPVQKAPSPKAVARAKAALAAKEKQKTPIQPIDKAAADKQLKLAEPKNKLVLEYIIHSSPALLYEFITSSSGLSEWFADNVVISGSTYSFFWEGAEQKARLLAIKENKSVRYQWTDRSPNTYFELRIDKNELTEELSLIITDFAETKEEISSLEVLWQGQIQRLMKVIGSKI